MIVGGFRLSPPMHERLALLLDPTNTEQPIIEFDLTELLNRASFPHVSDVPHLTGHADLNISDEKLTELCSRLIHIATALHGQKNQH